MMRHTLFALVCAAVSTVASSAFARHTTNTCIDRSGDIAVRTAAVFGPVVSNGVTKARLGSLYRDSLVVLDVALPSSAGVITNLVAGDNITIDSPMPGVRRISASVLSVPSGWDIVSNAALTAFSQSTNYTWAIVSNAALTAFSQSTNYTDAAIISRIAEDIDDASYDKILSAYNGAFLYEMVTNINDRANGMWRTVSTYISYLEHYATNNYKAARIANERVTDLELWRKSLTNAIDNVYFTDENKKLVNMISSAVEDPMIVRRDSPALTITAPGFNATGTNMGFRAKNTTYADGRINVTAGTNAYAVALPATNGTLARESWSSLSAMLVDANTNLDADRTSISTNLSKLVGSAGSIDGYVFDKDHVAMWYLDSGGFTNFVLRYIPSPSYGTDIFSVEAFGGYSEPVYYAMALGPGAIASGDFSTALGAIAAGESSTALGNGAYTTGSSSVALGSSAAANGSYTVALGPGAAASVSYAIALGLKAKASEENAVALGHNAAASERRSVALGTDTIANEWYSTAVGDYARAQGNCSLALGASPVANATHAMALGPYAVASGNYSIALGSSASAGWDYSVVIGSPAPGSVYSSHGTNTVNFAVTDNPDAVYFRDKTLSQMIREKAAELIKDAVKDLGPDVTAAALVEALNKIGEQ